MSVVRAAGGVVVRGGGGEPEVVLVYRARYDDWTFPKGKAEPDEADELTARREVEEETGLRCTLGSELDRVSYHDRSGRPKTVCYFLMHLVEVTRPFTPDDEIDDLRWCTFEEADALLTYDHDRAIARRARRLLASRCAP